MQCIYLPVSNVYNKAGLEKRGGGDDTGLPETISLRTVILTQYFGLALDINTIK